jgi:CRP-like cAMP-binding protein
MAGAVRRRQEADHRRGLRKAAPAMHRKLRLLRTNALDIMKQPEFDGFLDGFRLRRCESGATFVHDDAGDDAVCIVISGRLRVVLSYEGHEFTLSLLGQGDVFSTHTRAIVEAISPCEIMVADMKTFQNKLLDYPQFAVVLAALLGQVLTRAIDIIDSLVFHDVGQRLARLLAGVAEEKGQATPNGVLISLGMNTEDLGQLIGASRQTTSHLINDLVRQGLVERAGNRSFCVKNLPALRRLAMQPKVHASRP